MLIRSQDGKRLVDMTGMTITIGVSKGDTRIFAYGNNQPNADNIETLGMYSSEKTALKVLDKIQEVFVYSIAFQMPSDYKDVNKVNLKAEEHPCLQCEHGLVYTQGNMVTGNICIHPSITCREDTELGKYFACNTAPKWCPNKGGGRKMDFDRITLADCIDLYEKKGRETTVEGGHITKIETPPQE